MAGWADTPGATDVDKEHARLAVDLLRRVFESFTFYVDQVDEEPEQLCIMLNTRHIIITAEESTFIHLLMDRDEPS